MTTPASVASPLPALPADSMFSLTTSWRFDAPVQQVWRAIQQVSQWPQWWPYVACVTTLSPGDELGLGAVHRLTWRSELPYRLTFETHITSIQAPFAIDAQTSGDLSGHGRWRLFRTAGATVARYQWDVVPTKPWMRRGAPLMRSVFEWNHARVMRAGEAGLACWLPKLERD